MQRLTRADLNLMISAMENRTEQIIYDHIKNAENTESAECQIATIKMQRLINLTEILYTVLENEDKMILIK